MYAVGFATSLLRWPSPPRFGSDGDGESEGEGAGHAAGPAAGTEAAGQAPGPRVPPALADPTAGPDRGPRPPQGKLHPLPPGVRISPPKTEPPSATRCASDGASRVARLWRPGVGCLAW